MGKSKNAKAAKPQKSSTPKKSKKAAAPKKSKKSAAPRKPKKSAAPQNDIFKLRSNTKVGKNEKEQLHVFRHGIVCATEPRVRVIKRGDAQLEVVVDASDGFIPLWAPDTTLIWRFNERSLLQFEDPESVKNYVRELFDESMARWGTAAPVKFFEHENGWDFEIALLSADDCTASGCVLASAFFPDPGRHQLDIYPRMLEQSREEQVETMIHEIGHVFGLRHYFALTDESQFRAEIFGTHSKFSIMNYGDDSRLTTADTDDLENLYKLVWQGELTQINGVPIRLIRPFSTLADTPMDEVEQLQAAAKTQKKASYINK